MNEKYFMYVAGDDRPIAVKLDMHTDPPTLTIGGAESDRYAIEQVFKLGFGIDVLEPKRKDGNIEEESPRSGVIRFKVHLDRKRFIEGVKKLMDEKEIQVVKTLKLGRVMR